jgi:putative ABC transport system permease protein
MKVIFPLFTDGHGPGVVSLDPIMAGAAFFASIILGLIASLYPAMMASKLDPNEALRAL